MRPLPAPPRSPGPAPGRRTGGDDQAPHSDAQERSLDVEEALDVLLRDLRTSRDGLSSAEAQRRSLQYGTNELQRRERVSWPREVAAQLTQPLALLLWVAAGLEFAIGNSTVGIAVILVILINATMALFQERQAEQAVEALSAYLPQRTTFVRDGHPVALDASELVPGDVILLEEGERVPADVRLIEGAPIQVAIKAGRAVYDNVRKFIIYIFAHATPETVPFLVFALSGGQIPLPLTVLQLLAFDVGSETMPSLALGRDPAEPGIMEQPPRAADEPLIKRPMLLRAWLFLGVIVALLQMAGFFFVLTSAGWHPGVAVGVGHALHHTYLQATTMSFIGMMAGQIGTAFAVRTRRASLRSIGFFSNRYLLGARSPA